MSAARANGVTYSLTIIDLISLPIRMPGASQDYDYQVGTSNLRQTILLNRLQQIYFDTSKQSDTTSPILASPRGLGFVRGNGETRLNWRKSLLWSDALSYPALSTHMTRRNDFRQKRILFMRSAQFRPELRVRRSYKLAGPKDISS